MYDQIHIISLQAGPDADEGQGQINLASLPHAPTQEENAGGDASTCLIPSASLPIVAGASVYVKERNCEVCLPYILASYDYHYL